MGATTYEQVFSWDIAWPYQGLPTWVVTHRELPAPHGADIRFASGDVTEVLESVRGEVEGNVWLVGGADLVRQFLDARLIDELMLFVVPVVLGGGTPLFGGVRPAELELVATREWSTGLVELRYRPAAAG